MSRITDDDLLDLCLDVVEAVTGALFTVEDWSPPGRHPGQYAIDIAADDAALAVLDKVGIGVLSEESGRHRAEHELCAVLDPVDGSTNASRGIPWYATSICVVDALGPRVAVVANLATGVRYQAVRGEGAWRYDAAHADPVELHPSNCESMGKAIVALSGFPARHLGWAQFRSMGAAALDLCSVADGTVDAFATGGYRHLAPWDYLGALLVCAEARVPVEDLNGERLVVLDHSARRAVLAAATGALLSELIVVSKTARGAPPAGAEVAENDPSQKKV